MNYKMKDLIPMVSTLARQYTSKESSSVSEEKAKQFMEAVLFTMKLTTYPDLQKENQTLKKKELSAKEVYLLGGELLLNMFQKVQTKYYTCMESFESYGVICLEEVMKKGMPAFFQFYDLTYEPQNELLTLDYPILYNTHGKHGICVIDTYIKAIEIEQQFLQLFETQTIQEILKKINPFYEEAFLNIAESVYDYFLEYRVTSLLKEQEKAGEGEVSRTQFLTCMEEAKKEFYILLSTKIKAVETAPSRKEKQLQNMISYLELSYKDIAIRNYYKYTKKITKTETSVFTVVKKHV